VNSGKQSINQNEGKSEEAVKQEEKLS